jgi:hypothetical protein
LTSQVCCAIPAVGSLVDVQGAFGDPGGVDGHPSGQAVFSSPTICYFSLWREAPEKGNSLQFNGAF